MSPAEKGDGLYCRIGRGQAPTLHNIFVRFTLRHKTPGQFANLILAIYRGVQAEYLRQALTKAEELVEDYLRPQSLTKSDIIAQEVRNAFTASGAKLNKETILPLIENPSIARRIVGYIAYQTKPFMWVGEEFKQSLGRELAHAETSRETRPLWQLLVAIAFFATITNPEELKFLQFDMRSFLYRLETNSSLDPGGECKEKLRGLISHYSWMRGDR